MFGVASETYSVSLRLLSIYFGLCFVAAASALFAVVCPLQVKKYSSPEEYIAGDEKHLSELSQGLIEQNLKNGDNIAKERVDGLKSIYEEKPTPENIEELRLRDCKLLRNEMYLYYEMRDRSHAHVRWIVAIFYVIGLGALAVPAVSVFCRVSVVIFRALWNGQGF